jgi:hypothetical protein
VEGPRGGHPKVGGSLRERMGKGEVEGRVGGGWGGGLRKKIIEIREREVGMSLY